MAKQNEITFSEFQRRFNSEAACYLHLYQMKWPNGFRCPICGNDTAYEITTRTLPLYECTNCKHQTSLKAGTIFEKSRISLLIWFWVIFLIAHDKRGVSALYLSKEFRIAYQTAWTMVHKIRKAMAERDSSYTLAGIVEMDETYFGAPTEGGKRGRGTDKILVLAALSLTSSGCPEYLKMEVIENLKSETLTEFAKKNIGAKTVIVCDGFKSYKPIAKENYQLDEKPYDPKSNPDHLNWIHTAISNAKAFIGGTFHGGAAKHLQSYLDEYCYRFNRRGVRPQLFNRLLMCCSLTRAITYPELVG